MAPHSLLQSIKAQTAAELRGAGTRRTFARGAFLFHEGDAARQVFLMEKGLAKVQTASVDGQISVLGFRGPGVLLGEQSVLDGEPMSASAVALDSVEAVVIRARRLQELMLTCPDLTYGILQQLNRALRASSRLINQLATADAVTRVANRIVDLAALNEQASGQPIRATQQDLADWAGLSREAVVRSLRTLRDEGTIETGRMSVLVLDEAALHERALLTA